MKQRDNKDNVSTGDDNEGSYFEMKFLRVFIVIEEQHGIVDNVSFLINSKDTVRNVIKEAVVRYNRKLMKQKVKFYINKQCENYVLMFSLSGGMPNLIKNGPEDDKEINEFDVNEFTLVWKEDPSNFTSYIIRKPDKQICQNNCVVI